MVALVVALLGLAVGSFLNVVIGRLRSGETSWRSRSRCPECHAVLRPSELVPVLSFLALRGKCRSCKKPISWQYPLVEFSTAILFLLAYSVEGGAAGLMAQPLAFVRDALAIAGLTIVFVIDLLDMVIYDEVVLPLAGALLVTNLLLGYSLGNLLMAAAIGAGFFLLQYAVSRGRWIGGGDIRLGAVMGALLGFPAVVLALLFAYVIGAATALGLLAGGKAKWSSQMAFGTFLSVSTIATLFFGQSVISWYASLLSF